MTRICIKCKKQKMLSVYYKNSKKCKQCVAEYQKVYQKNYLINNRAMLNAKYNKRRQNEIFRLKQNMRRRLWGITNTKNIPKNGNKSIDFLGCNYLFFNKWVNYNKELDNLPIKFHIDHLIALTHATNEEELKKLFHWTNTIPTTEEYNLQKHTRNPTKHELFKQQLRLFIFNKLLKSNIENVSKSKISISR